MGNIFHYGYSDNKISLMFLPLQLICLKNVSSYFIQSLKVKVNIEEIYSIKSTPNGPVFICIN